MRDSTTVAEEVLKDVVAQSQKRKNDVDRLKTASEVLEMVSKSVSDLSGDDRANEDVIYWLCAEKLDDATSHTVSSMLFLANGIIDALYKYAMNTRIFMNANASSSPIRGSEVSNHLYKLMDDVNNAANEFVILYNKLFFTRLLDQRKSENESEV